MIGDQVDGDDGRVLNTPPLIGELNKQRISEANAGDTESARRLLEEFVETVKNNRDKDGHPYRKPSGIHTQFDEAILDWFTDCFQKIIDGVDAEKALGIKLQRGRQSKVGSKNDEDCAICLSVFEYRRQFGSETIADAKARAARKLKVGIEKVGHAWKNKSARQAAEASFRLAQSGDK